MRESSEIFAGDAGRFQGCETNDHMDKPSGAKREGCAFQMDLFADIMKQTVRELEKVFLRMSAWKEDSRGA